MNLHNLYFENLRLYNGNKNLNCEFAFEYYLLKVCCLTILCLTLFFSSAFISLFFSLFFSLVFFGSSKSTYHSISHWSWIFVLNPDWTTILVKSRMYPINQKKNPPPLYISKKKIKKINGRIKLKILHYINLYYPLKKIPNKLLSPKIYPITHFLKKQKPTYSYKP